MAPTVLAAGDSRQHHIGRGQELPPCPCSRKHPRPISQSARSRVPGPRHPGTRILDIKVAQSRVAPRCHLGDYFTVNKTDLAVLAPSSTRPGRGDGRVAAVRVSDTTSGPEWWLNQRAPKRYRQAAIGYNIHAVSPHSTFRYIVPRYLPSRASSGCLPRRVHLGWGAWRLQTGWLAAWSGWHLGTCFPHCSPPKSLVPR